MLNPVCKDAFQPVAENTCLNAPARLAVGLELESALLERRTASLPTTPRRLHCDLATGIWVPRFQLFHAETRLHLEVMLGGHGKRADCLTRVEDRRDVTTISILAST